MVHISLPPELSSLVGSEKTDFVVKAGRVQPLKKSLSAILIGIIWMTIIIAVAFPFLGPLFQGKEIRFEADGVPIVASRDNLGPIIIPAIILGILGIVGIVILFREIHILFKEGGYFIGTPTRLICYQNGNIRSIDWEQFSGDIKVTGSAQKGDIYLEMRTGRVETTYTGSRIPRRGSMFPRRGVSRFVPDVIYISEIPNPFEIAEMCRRRIKENDPTLPKPSQ